MVNNFFENFNDSDEEWLTELEIRDADLQSQLLDWREAHARELAETSYGPDETPPRTRADRREFLRAQPRPARPGQAQPGQAQPRPTQYRQTQPRPRPPEAFRFTSATVAWLLSSVATSW